MKLFRHVLRIIYRERGYMNKLVKMTGITVVLGVVLATPVFALGSRALFRADAHPNIATHPGVLGKIFNANGRAALSQATLTAKNGTTLTVTGTDGKTYTVNTDGTTQFRRRFWGKSSLDEMNTGDKVDIIGKWTDSADTTIQAKLVRDTSIQKRFGVFFGSVTSTTGSGFVVATINRGSQTVTIDSTTKLLNRKGATIAQSDIAAGHKVRVRGLWDNTANTITQVTEVKDFSLPVVTTTPTPTP